MIAALLLACFRMESPNPINSYPVCSREKNVHLLPCASRRTAVHKSLYTVEENQGWRIRDIEFCNPPAHVAMG